MRKPHAAQAELRLFHEVGVHDNSYYQGRNEGEVRNLVRGDVSEVGFQFEAAHYVGWGAVAEGGEVHAWGCGHVEEGEGH